MAPAVSVIMPVYNSEKFLEESADSVLSQQYDSLELILIDDGSTDTSRDIIRKLAAKDQRVKPLFLHSNLGSAGARNEGIKRAEGHYIAFLDSDDIWLPEKLAIQLPFMEKLGTPVSFTAYRKIDSAGVPGSKVRVPEEVDYLHLLKTNSIGMLTAVFDKEMVGARLLPEIRLQHDYALWLQILRDGHVARGLNRVLAHHRIHGNSISRNKADAARYQWRVYRELEELGRIKSAWYFAHYAVYGLLKHR
ncbi:MAG: glycosyl transferase [Acidobacteria bacterium CG_4_9_14_3_um_filter_49_7]|nr:MAG: glycosyl transferase [Acidobacteria bacterium CG_4_9_14_3_um_filter_49_7]